MQSLIVRTYELGMITNRQYRYLFEQLSARGWRAKEPGNLDLPEEKPQLFAKMVERLYGSSAGTMPESYSRDMHLTLKRAVELIDSYIDKRKPPLDNYVASPTQWIHSNN